MCRIRTLSRLLPLLLLALACEGSGAGAGVETRLLVVINAGSLARPFRAALDTFARRNAVRIQQENAGSLEAARKVVELHQMPDVIALADYEVFPRLLMPAHVTWYLGIARNRMVIAYSEGSRGAASINSDNWIETLKMPGVEIGRAEPALDPAGYRAILMFQLAEMHYGRPGLKAELLAAAHERNIRPKSAELVALVQAGEVDYCVCYESVARAAGLRFVRLPAEIDLGSVEFSDNYLRASVSVPANSMSESITMPGQPIMYALSIPASAPHAALAEKFVAFLLSEEGRHILRENELDVLHAPVLVGEGAPEAVLNALSGSVREQR